mgnify:CR=1 FL=1
MHKLMGAYIYIYYIYEKAVELLQYSVEKSKNSIFDKNQRTTLCTVFSAVYAIYQNGI